MQRGDVLIAIGSGLLFWVAKWVYDLIQMSKAVAETGQRATAGPMLIPMMAIIPVGMLLVLVGVVMRTKRS